MGQLCIYFLDRVNCAFIFQNWVRNAIDPYFVLNSKSLVKLACLSLTHVLELNQKLTPPPPRLWPSLAWVRARLDPGLSLALQPLKRHIALQFIQNKPMKRSMKTYPDRFEDEFIEKRERAQL